MGTQFASSEFKWCADVDYKPAEVDCSKPIEITVLFGEGKENEMLVKQSLQFLATRPASRGRFLFVC